MAEKKKITRTEFGNQLRKYRTEAGISQENLAKATKKSQSGIGPIENGEVGISLDSIEELASYFGVKYYDFCNPSVPIPSKSVLRQNIRKYISSKGINPGYLDNENVPRYASNLTKYVEDGNLNHPKSSSLIAKEYEVIYGEKISPSKVSDVFSKNPKSEMIIVSKPAKGRGNLYQVNAAALAKKNKKSSL